MKCLIQIEGERIARRIPLKKESYRIGRINENDIIFDSSKISRLHATLIEEGNTYCIVDENSSNGVFVNNERISRKKLDSGDEINLGRDIKLLFFNESDAEEKISSALSRLWDAINKRDFLKLKEVTKRILSLGSLQEILQIILQETIGLVNAERGFIALTDRNCEIVPDVFVSQGITFEEIKDRSHSFSRSIVKKATEEGRPVCILNTDEDGGDLSLSIRELELRSLMCSPLHFSDRMLGILYVDAQHRIDSFDEVDQFFFSMLTDHASIAIEISNHYSQMKKTIEKNRESYDRAVASLPAIIWEADLLDSGEFRNVYVSDTADTMLGLEKGTIQNDLMKLYQFVHTDDRPVVMHRLRTWRMKPDDTMELEYRVVCSDGSQRWFSTIISARRLDDGILHLYGITEDMTEKKKAEEQIRLSEIKFRTIVENINDALYLLDFSGTVQDINENACRMLGYSREELIGAHFSIAYGSGNIDHVSECIARVKKQGSHVFDDEHFRKDGSVVSVSVSATLISRERNGVIQAFVRDMSERRRHEAELIRAKEDAERTNRLRAVFLSNMSHEIRTPMHGIIGFARLLQASLEDEEQIEHVDLILKSSERLMTTIDDILDFSRLESKSYAVSIQQVDIVKETEECLSLLLSIAKEKGIYLQCRHDGRPVYTGLDRHAYGKVLNNLVGNAFKFTVSGGVTVSIDAKDGECQVRVRDTGQGIPEEYFNTVFEEFRQVSEGFSRSHEGSGLGLAISRNLVELMNGKLCVEQSVVGEGTTFLITFPLAGKDENDAGKPGPEPAVRVECNEDPVSRKMLFVDDESISVLLAKSIFSNRPNYTVDYARSAGEALELARCNSYEVILLDIGLGGDIDGVEVMKRIREMDTNRNARFIAVTGYAFNEQRIQLSAVFDGYISKPYDSVDIFELLGRLNLPG